MVVVVVVVVDAFIAVRGAVLEVQKPPTRKPPANCERCPTLNVPEDCAFVGKEEELQKTRGREGRGLLSTAMPSRRRGAARIRTKKTATTTTRRRKKSRGQTQPFAPPSEEFVDVVRANLKYWRDTIAGTRCGLWTYECVKNYWPEDKIHMNVTREITHPRHPFLRLFVGNKVPPEEKWRNFFPDVKAKGFGTCAVVAVGSNLLKSERGEEIDAHDTVIRYNSPLKKYEKSVGRKSDIMYWKIRGDEKEYGQEGQKASKFYMFKDETKLRMVASKKELNENTFKGKPILWSSPRRSSVFEAAYFLYKKENKKVSRGSASGGFKLAGDILASGLCTRVDLYGYSSEGAGKYFNLGKTMSSVHLMGLENFIYRIAQDQEMMCVYD